MSAAASRRRFQRTQYETYDSETLREGGTTAAENESSVVLGGYLDGGTVLLTGDAGLKALATAADYAGVIGLPLQNALHVFQVPHHGSRNNISPSMLNRLVGGWTARRPVSDCLRDLGRTEDETHPRQVVVNALIRRGLQPLVTRGGTILCPSQVSQRPGFGPAQPLAFSHSVEAYD